jgi:8-oxo-dGTP pyrophosphatase MutT (NUDIX family)
MTERETRVEICAGGVVYRPAGDGVEVALAEERDRLSGTRNTRLAKGHLDTGETPEAAALREVREEIGVAAEIVAPLGSVHYTYVEDGRRVAKQVHFFLMQVASAEPLALDGEMERMYWCPIEQAATRLTFETEQCVVERARHALGA